MLKLNFTVVAVIVMSIMIGSTIITADAAKPETTQIIDPDCLAEDGGFCFTSYTDICGVDKVSGRESIITTLTTWDSNDKYKIVTTHSGKLYESGTNLTVLIGTVDNTQTTHGFFDGKAATVEKQTFTIDCLNGEKDIIEQTIIIDNLGKQSNKNN